MAAHTITINLEVTTINIEELPWDAEFDAGYTGLDEQIQMPEIPLEITWEEWVALDGTADLFNPQQQ